MSTIKTTYIQHPSSGSPNIELAADGTVVLPLSDLEDLNNVSGTPTDGQILAFGTATSTWNPVDGGKILQVVVGTDSTQRNTTSTVYVDADISASITPLRGDSTLYVFWSVNVESGNADSSSAAASRTHLQITDASNTALEGAELVNTMGRPQGTIPTVVESVPFILGRVAASDTTTRTYKGRFKYEGNASGAVCALKNTEATGMMVIVEVGA